jgi:peptidoglycan-N-acetylglucosamine deacetylase
LSIKVPHSECPFRRGFAQKGYPAAGRLRRGVRESGRGARSNLSLGLLSSGIAAAAGIATWGAVAPWSQLYGPTLRHTGTANRIALTFDDGPNPAVTPRLLELFERYSVRVTFFLIGKFTRACPDLVKEIGARGHALGNHTDSHARLVFHSSAGIRRELARCQEAIAGATRTEPPLWMRPPYGYRNPLLQGEVRRAKMKGVVMWSKSCRDWKPQSPERLIKRLARVACADSPSSARSADGWQASPRRGDIIVFHDGDHRALGGDRQHVVAALEYWLPRWRDAGIEFVTIE